MDATPPPATPPPANPPQIALRPPPRTSNDLRMLFFEAEQDIITKKGNSQLGFISIVYLSFAFLVKLVFKIIDYDLLLYYYYCILTS